MLEWAPKVAKICHKHAFSTRRFTTRTLSPVIGVLFEEVENHAIESGIVHLLIRHSGGSRTDRGVEAEGGVEVRGDRVIA